MNLKIFHLEHVLNRVFGKLATYFLILKKEPQNLSGLKTASMVPLRSCEVHLSIGHCPLDTLGVLDVHRQ